MYFDADFGEMRRVIELHIARRDIRPANEAYRAKRNIAARGRRFIDTWRRAPHRAAISPAAGLEVAWRDEREEADSLEGGSPGEIIAALGMSPPKCRRFLS